MTLALKGKTCFFANKHALKKELIFLPSILDISAISSTPLSFLRSDILLRWGQKPTKNGLLTDILAKFFGKKKVYLEDGLIRSVNIGLSGEPTISLIASEVSSYYNSITPNSLQNILDSDSFHLTAEQISSAKQAMILLKEHKISKYNNAPILQTKITPSTKKKILIIDQRHGDYSIVKNKASEQDFIKMIKIAVNNYPEFETIVKKHPDSKVNGYKSYISDEIIAQYPNVITIDYNANPYSLFEQVDKIFTVTSQMGFEALLANKEVHCFGNSFYSGRGLTIDSDNIKQKKSRSLIDIFYAIYFTLTQYFHPTAGKSCDIFGAIDYILERTAYSK